MDQKVLIYAKFIIAAIGTAATACLGVIPEGSTTWTILTIIAAIATSLLVLIVPNLIPGMPPPDDPPVPTQLPAGKKG
jgi:hypothetical protein